MNSKTLLLTALVLMQPLFFYATSFADIGKVKAEWKQNTERLSINVKDKNNNGSLTVTYNGQNYPMSYNERKKRYELILTTPTCYENSVAIVSSSGETKTQSVRTRGGNGSGYECTPPPTKIGKVKAEWKQNAERLSINVKDKNNNDSLTVTYNKKIFPMSYNERKKRHELIITPICYENSVVIVSLSGETKSQSVRTRGGNGSGYECTTEDSPHAELTATGYSPHAELTFAEYPANCLSCHYVDAMEMQNSTHYEWVGETPDMVNSDGTLQGKLTNAVNSYCINIKGDWPVCGSCHVGRGKKPDDPTAGPENIDCLACHNEEYATARARLDDGSMGVAVPSDSMVQNIQAPTRVNCLKCHATAGGGDGVKRGDLSIATGTNSDPNFDVHMNTSGPDLSCQSCHVFQEHKVIGKGSDLRPTDDLMRGSEIQCITCHSGKGSPSGHDNEEIGRHVARVACQTCHIPTYAKVATETYRDWRRHAGGGAGPGHPLTVKEENLIPEYMFWNRLSDNALLGDDASKTLDPLLGTYPTSRPVGSIEDGMLYPFKYKTATQPITVNTDRLIALDTLEYLKKSGNVDLAIKNGLVNMGYSADEPYTWIDTDTYQMLNHGITPASSALQCSSCHGNTNRIDLQNELGYGLKGPESSVCFQCHGSEDRKPFKTIHDKHVKDKGYDCSNCHNFSRPELGLRVRG